MKVNATISGKSEEIFSVRIKGRCKEHATRAKDGKSFNEEETLIITTNLKCHYHHGKTEMETCLSCGDKKTADIPPSEKTTKKLRLIRWLTRKFHGKVKPGKTLNHDADTLLSLTDSMESSTMKQYMRACRQTSAKNLSKSTSDLCRSDLRNSLRKQETDQHLKSRLAKSVILDPSLLCTSTKELSKPTYLPVGYPASNLSRRWRSCIGLENYTSSSDSFDRSQQTMTLSSRTPTTTSHSKTGSKLNITDQCLREPTESDTLSMGSGVSSDSYCKFRDTFGSESSLSMCDEYRGNIDERLSPILSRIPVPNLSPDSTCTSGYLKYLSEQDYKEQTKRCSSMSNFPNPNLLLPCPLTSSNSSAKYSLSCSPLSSLSSSECDSAIDVFSPDEEWHDVKRTIPSCKSPSKMDCPVRSADFMPPQVIITDYDDSMCQPCEAGSDLMHSLDFLDSNLRKYSSSSICSDVSDYSTISSSSNEERTEKNHWKKIKNAVQWTPFIQHFKKHKYPWIQLAGHQGCFQAGEPGTILKKLNVNEQKFYETIENDCLKMYVPESRGEIIKEDGEKFLQLEDLLTGFNCPCVMDIKMGVRTYLEEELVKARENPKLRTDMFQKMVEIDPNAPTPEESSQKAITKPRYMQWRETISSSASLGFRIEGIKRSNGDSSKDFKRTKTREQVQSVLKNFTDNDLSLLREYCGHLKKLRSAIESSTLFKEHEVIGSSLLFIHDRNHKVGIWLIDFGKTVRLPCHVTVNHRNPWAEGNHEDGYLFGMDNLISIIEELH